MYTRLVKYSIFKINFVLSMPVFLICLGLGTYLILKYFISALPSMFAKWDWYTLFVYTNYILSNNITLIDIDLTHKY